MFSEDELHQARALPVLGIAERHGAKLKKSGREHAGPCPVCNGVDRFAVWPAKNLWNCRGCGVGGDAIKLEMHLSGVEFIDAMKTLIGDDAGTESRRQPTPDEIRTREAREAERKRAEAEEQARNESSAARIAARLQPVAGTPGEAYLRDVRRIDVSRRTIRRILENVDAIGWCERVCFRQEGHELNGQWLGAIIGILTDPVTGQRTGGITRTYLHQGRKIGKTKSLGGVGQLGIIRLSPDDEVGAGLHLCEGIESALSAMMKNFCPMWAAGSTSQLADFPVLNGIEFLTVVADRQRRCPTKGARMNERLEDFPDDFMDDPDPNGPQRPPKKEDLPKIQIRAGEMERAVNEAEEALIAAHAWSPADSRVFRRGDRIVSLAIDKGPDHKGRIVEGQIIVELSAHTIAERLGVAAIFLKFDSRMKGGGGLKRVDPPMELVMTLMGRGYSLKLPVLVAVVNCPQMAANGRILDKPGYDAETGVFYDPRGATFSSIAESPTREEALADKDKLLVLFHTFDFQGEADRAVAMSLLFTRLARIGMASAPLHDFDAPTAGSGKSMLVDIVSILTTGERAIVFAQGATLEEFEKRLSVQLMKGRQIVALDNVTSDLEGDLLNQALTQEKVDLRILGASRAVTTRCASVLTATGNNLKVVGDLTRRTIIARLDPKIDRPELRQFDYDPLTNARENRSDLVAAALTVMKAYHIAGRPGCPPRLQGFEDWSDLVRGALMWIGLEDPVATQDRLRENDPKLTKLIRVATVWRKAFGVYSTTVAEAVEKAEERRRGGTYEESKYEPVNPDLLDALLSVARRGPAINPDMVGKYLSSEVERVVTLEAGAQVRFERVGKRQGAVLWSLAAVGAAGGGAAGGVEIPFN